MTGLSDGNKDEQGCFVVAVVKDINQKLSFYSN